MSVDFEKEIEDIKKNIKEMYEMLRNDVDMQKINHQVSATVNELMSKFIYQSRPAEPSEPTPPPEPKVYADIDQTKQLWETLIQKRIDNNVSGYITYFGDFSASDRESKWMSPYVNTDELLTLIEDKSAVKVLNCIGNSLRLDILLAILKQPMTVAELVEHFGSNSTGQIYHHLGPLMTADLIVEDKNHKGVYIVQPHRVQGILMMLAGIKDMIDTKYTEGNWTSEI